MKFVKFHAKVKKKKLKKQLFHIRITKIMKFIDFDCRTKKLMKIKLFNARITKIMKFLKFRAQQLKLIKKKKNPE